MKLLTLLLLPITATALQTTNPITATDDNNPTPSLKVPGRNPLTYCEDPLASKHILLIKSVDLEPNPPEAGTPLSIKATGNFTREVVEGAYVNLSVKLGLITLLRRREDLCAQLKEVEKECPLEVGETSISREVDLPSVIPPVSNLFLEFFSFSGYM